MNPILGIMSQSLRPARADGTTPRVIVPETQSVISPAYRMPSNQHQTVTNFEGFINLARVTHTPSFMAHQLLRSQDPLAQSHIASMIATPVIAKTLTTYENSEPEARQPMFVTAA